MVEGRINWKASKPEPGVLEHMYVTGRTREVLCEHLYMRDEDFLGKVSLSIGNGLSNLPKHVNQLSADTCCFGVDPSYALLETSYEEFCKNIGRHNLAPHGKYTTKQVYEEFRQGVASGTYIAATGEHLPFKDGGVDVVIIANVIDNLSDHDTVLGILDEVDRVLKFEGEIRIPELVIAQFGSGEGSLGPGEGLEKFNYKKPEDWFDILRKLRQKGFQAYSVYDPCGFELRDAKTGLCGEIVPCFKGLILRKDGSVPDAIGTSDIEELGEYYPIAELDIEHSHSPFCIPMIPS